MINDIQNARNDFPIFETLVNGKKLVYLDSAATTLKPKQVVDRISQYYLYESSNVHRGVHYLSDLGTRNFEASRETVRKFINAKESSEVIFNSGTTASINFIAQTYVEQFLKSNDEILLSEVEHHSNIVPWQIVAEKKGIKIKTFEVKSTQEETLKSFQSQLTPNTKFVSCTQISNTLGCYLPVQEIIKMSHQAGARVFIDAAQAIAHTVVDVQNLNCDFLTFSAHKLYGPTGFGVLYIKKEIADQLNPYLGGGGMIDQVTFEKTTYIDAPFKFEPGTPHIEGAIGLKSAIEYVESYGLKAISKYEAELTDLALQVLSDIPNIEIYGPKETRSAIISLNIKNIHPSDIGSLLDQYGIAVRTGHHCTQPIMRNLNVPGTVRISFAIYNTKEEVIFLNECLRKVIKMLS